MAALPYIQLYVADYLADTAHLTTLQHGAYLLLIMNYWQRGKSFKAIDKRSLSERLANISRMSSEEWENSKEVLKEFFETTETEWKHKRIESDLELVKGKSEKAKAAGSLGGRQLRSDRQANAKRTLSYTDTDTDTDTDIYNIPYQDIVAYLNQVCHTKYRLSDGMKKHIRARFVDKYTLADFKTVIRKKTDEWLGSDHAKYLRPETLFGPKFDTYLNQPEKKIMQSGMDYLKQMVGGCNDTTRDSKATDIDGYNLS